VISRLFAGVYGQGTRTVLNRQTSFGTFGGGDANISRPARWSAHLHCSTKMYGSGVEELTIDGIAGEHTDLLAV
jgi:hypothetical protein